MKYEPHDRHFYVHDRLGSVRQVIRGWCLTNSYTYGPFSEMIAADCNEDIENPFKFTGQFYDSEIGQYYLRARQYDPQLMRFSGRDPIDGSYEEPMTLHKYMYCLNDPIDYVDPTGESLDTITSVSIGAEMYAQDLAVGGLAAALVYAIVIQNELYQEAIESICTGFTYEVDNMIDFGLDVYAIAQTKAARKDIAGAMKQINIHLNKISNSSGSSPNDPIKQWLKHVRKHLRNVAKAADRLKGKEQEETLKYVEDTWKQLEGMAKEHGLPWGS